MSSVRLSVCPSVTLVDHDHIGWKSWKLTVWTNNPTSSLFVAHRSSTYFQGNMEKFREENVRSTLTSIKLTSITSGWIESTESHVTWVEVSLFVVCLFLSLHRAVIFMIVQLSCYPFSEIDTVTANRYERKLTLACFEHTCFSKRAP